MNKNCLWFLLSGKRYLKRPGFLILLLALPLFSWWISGTQKEKMEGIAIAVYGCEEGFNRQVWEKLEGGDTMFRFYLAEDEGSLINQVIQKKAECGYVFPQDLESRLNSGDYKRSVQIYYAPSTMVSDLAAEVVFAAIMEVYGKQLLTSYVEETLMPGEENKEEVSALFDRYYLNGSTFSFEYGVETGGKRQEETAVAKFPVRGVLSVCLFITGICGAAALAQDEKKGLFLPVPYHQKLTSRLAALAAPLVLTAVSCSVSLWAAGEWSSFWYELAAMTGYVFAVILFSYALGRIVKNPALLYAMVPFWITGSLILCPVFIDAGAWIPGLDALGHMFLPYYYLNAF